MQLYLVTIFSQTIEYLKTCPWLGVNGPAWEVGFQPFELIPHGLLTILHAKTCLLHVGTPFLNFILHDNNKLGFSEILCINIVKSMILKANYINKLLILSFKNISNVI